MQIQVKSVKVLSKGTNDYGEWKLVKVTTADTEYTTLAKEADTLKPGMVINITDMDEDEKGKKFKKYEVVNAGDNPATAPNSPATVQQPNDHEYWERKQAIERRSIERQVSAKIAFEFVFSENPTKTLAVSEEIYQWISGQGTTPDPLPKDTEPQKKVSTGEIAPPLQNKGELFSRAAKFGLSPQDVLAAAKEKFPEITSLEEITNFDGAWEATATKFKGTIKAQQEAK
ncbi:hypothetical protein LCGC14_0527660 [marine sediment metagenome]|uniref:Uncharacterized protein n=1 Tax=marine sediment metagenome TaxID=412755 RepID=A0A0F9RWW4_9ZZZZ